MRIFLIVTMTVMGCGTTVGPGPRQASETTAQSDEQLSLRQDPVSRDHASYQQSSASKTKEMELRCAQLVSGIRTQIEDYAMHARSMIRLSASISDRMVAIGRRLRPTGESASTRDQEVSGNIVKVETVRWLNTIERINMGGLDRSQLLAARAACFRATTVVSCSVSQQAILLAFLKQHLPNYFGNHSEESLALGGSNFGDVLELVSLEGQRARRETDFGISQRGLQKQIQEHQSLRCPQINWELIIRDRIQNG
jgi:hypothetical protein